MNNIKKILFPVAALFILLTGCKKYLDEKPDKKLAVPVTIADAQALLDNYGTMNAFYPYCPAVSDDDYYLPESYFNSLSVDYRNIYTWDKGVASNTRTASDWNLAYANILTSNLARETVDKITPTAVNLADWKLARGGALFFHAYNLYQLLQVYATPYDAATAASRPGIPLKLTADINEAITRPDMATCYNEIIAELKAAADLLPATTIPKSRPSKAAAFGVLARVYMAMELYDNAGKYADSTLQIYAALIDYNTISTTAAQPFTRFNIEVIFHSNIVSPPMLNQTNWRVDTLLYQSYAANDLRKILFFKMNGSGASAYYTYKGNYEESINFFNGIATDEQYLIRAECFARAGNTAPALQSLNTLLVKRWKTGTFIPLTAPNAEEALKLILKERRKELVARGIRWLDLRRLNKDPRFAITLKRTIGGVDYLLPPNDNRYTIYIPETVIGYSGIVQNER